MSYSEILTILLSISSSIAFSGVFSSLIIYFTKTWVTERVKQAVKHEYDLKLESYKAVLKAESETKLEQLKAELQIETAKQHIRFSKIHEKQAEVLVELYNQLTNFRDASQTYVSFFGDSPSNRDDLLEATNSCYKPLAKYFNDSSIYLPEEIDSKLKELIKKIKGAVGKFQNKIAAEKQNLTSAEYEGQWTEIEQGISVDARECLRELKSEFKKLLGTEIG